MLRKFVSHGLWIPSRMEFISALACLSHEERAAAMRYAFQRDVLSCICGKLLARHVASQILNVCSTEIKIGRTEMGKPFVLNADRLLDFNISHGGNLTTFVVFLEGACGVDVMRVELPPCHKSANTFVHTLAKVFAPRELDSILSASDDNEKMCRFYRYWCLKEAYLKALGCGIRLPLSSVVFELPKYGHLPPLCSSLSPNCQDWYFEEHILPDSHVAAIAWHANTTMPSFEKHPFEEVSITSLLDNLTPFGDLPDDQWTAFSDKPREPPLVRQAVMFNSFG
ncbi:L-aminoadipate-semialdehyde dehydrogenase-phosphopantetheinyl transferase [Fasciolopsis buskii]|uniref:L-aminoadipate-semialdehyde dehydrogenase-phosphopantetheinyl transferase n=1 Tax=Fasciolopsis buskii TaxID=27845 RepID=A0A8E0RK61_9TREM|nr:L-aminoadipate-semialdehyde dehydrogenase-phosphopantetheinyl transferase [Fasciolopsis buski]